MDGITSGIGPSALGCFRNIAGMRQLMLGKICSTQLPIGRLSTIITPTTWSWWILLSFSSWWRKDTHQSCWLNCRVSSLLGCESLPTYSAEESEEDVWVQLLDHMPFQLHQTASSCFSTLGLVLHPGMCLRDQWSHLYQCQHHHPCYIPPSTVGYLTPYPS